MFTTCLMMSVTNRDLHHLILFAVKGWIHSTYLPLSDCVVNPIWLFTIKCTLPPTEKCGTSAIENVSATIP